MSDIAALVADNLDVWTGAIERKSGAGRGGGKRISLYGIDRLRALILDLAVRGKLVSQDAGDEPAEKFFKRLGVPIRKSPKPNLNRGWAEASLADLGEFVGGITPSKGVSRYWGEGHPWVSPKDMGEDQLITSEDQVTQAALEETSLKMVPAGSLVMVARSGILRRKFPVAITNMPCTLNQDMKALVLRPSVNQRYLQVMLKGFQPRVLSDLVKTGMTVESLIFKDFTKALWPIPPLAEQQRIVAKVDKLMALCNALEHESAGAMAAHQALVEILLATLVNSADATNLARDWARLESHFDTLFTTDASIDALKQTILDLAVRGKLVEQDAADDDADEMLSYIGSNKTDRVKRGNEGAPGSPTNSSTEAPFRVPSGWAWARFSQVATIRAELVQSLDFPDAVQIAPDVIEKGTGKLLKVRTVAEAGVVGPNSRFYAGQIIYSKIRPSLSKAVIAETDGLCSADMYPLDAHINVDFLLRLILSEPFLQQVRIAENRIKMPKLNKDSLNAFVVPVPPLAEQRRIVAKIDALMALCDALKAGLSEAAKTQRDLADAIIERAAA